VRPHPVVVEPPVCDGFPGVVQRQEPVLVQAFLAELAVERFDVSVLHGASRGDEVQRHLILIGPLVQHLRRELGAMIDDDPLRQTVLQPQLFQHAHHAQCQQRGVRLNDEGSSSADLSLQKTRLTATHPLSTTVVLSNRGPFLGGHSVLCGKMGSGHLFNLIERSR